MRISSSSGFLNSEFRKWLEQLLKQDPASSYANVLRRALLGSAAEIARRQSRSLPAEFGFDLPYSQEATTLSALDLGRTYEAFLSVRPEREQGNIVWTEDLTVRRESGIYYTPPRLVSEVLKFALLGRAGETRICDIACGAGAFLVPAAKSLADQSGRPLKEIVQECIFGVDLDPIAAELCRVILWLECDAIPPRDHLLSADTLLSDWSVLFPEVHAAGGFDVIVGNPPFGGVVEGRVSPQVSELRKSRYSAVGGTADLSSYFLSAAFQIARQDSRIAVVMPRSFLTAHASAKLRNPARFRLSLKKKFSGHTSFQGASIHVCIVGYESRGARESSSETGTTPSPKGLEVTASLTVGEAYKLAGSIQEDATLNSYKLLTCGLIDPAAAKWGSSRCRFLKRDYLHPWVAAQDIPPRRLSRAARPKLIVAGLSRTLECILDTKGEYLGSVGTYTVTHASDDLSILRDAMEYLHSTKANTKFRRELGASALGGGNITVTKRFLQSALASAGF